MIGLDEAYEIERGTFSLHYVPTKWQEANTFTKLL